MKNIEYICDKCGKPFKESDGLIKKKHNSEGSMSGVDIPYIYLYLQISISSPAVSLDEICYPCIYKHFLKPKLERMAKERGEEE